MMDGVSLMNNMEDCVKQLEAAVNSIGRRGREMAEAERNYRIAFAKAVLEEKAKGTNMTIIESVVKGTEEIANLKLEWATKETMYENNIEFANMCKVKIRVLEGHISREWGRRD